jgi:AraC-like DNA-binding protein
MENHMPRKPTGRPNGRPKKTVKPPVDPKAPPAEWKGTIPEKEINLDQVLYWTELQATAEEIAGAFRVSVDTLDRRLREAFGMGFAELRKRCNGLHKLSLRRYQFQQAERNATMAIWLGKIWLGQRETIVTETIVKGEDPVRIYIPDNGRGDCIEEKVEDPNA